ncbi:MAG: Rnase Y domain-containing protein, partial [Chloroflexota bacterium]
MKTIDPIVYLAIVSVFFIGLVFGGAVVFFFRRMSLQHQLRNAQRKAARMVTEARDEAKEIVRESKEESEKTKAATENETRQRRAELQRSESRLTSKTETLDRRIEGLEQRERNLTNREKGIETIHNEVTAVKDKQLKQLETISGMTNAEAKQELLGKIEPEIKEEGSRRLREWEVKLREEADRKAQEILSHAIQRSAS